MTIEIIDCEQGTPEWFQARLGLPTASKFKDVIAKGKGLTRATYMRKLAGEVLTGEPMEVYTNKDLERGKVMESEARAAYAFLTGAELQKVGFISNGRKGCSPDGLIGTDGMLEIKTERADLLIDTLLHGEVPPEHVAQCQGQLWVAERKWVDLVVYWPKLPLFVRRIHRDEAYIRMLASEVEAFNAELDDMVKRVRAL